MVVGWLAAPKGYVSIRILRICDCDLIWERGLCGSSWIITSISTRDTWKRDPPKRHAERMPGEGRDCGDAARSQGLAGSRRRWRWGLPRGFRGSVPCLQFDFWPLEWSENKFLLFQATKLDWCLWYIIHYGNPRKWVQIDPKHQLTLIPSSLFRYCFCQFTQVNVYVW